MFAIEPAGLHRREEELASIGIGAGICHWKDTWTSVFQLEILIFELRSINGLSASAIMIGEISSLTHEIRNDSVEGASLVAESLFTGAQGSEIFSRFWHDIGTKLDDNSSHRLSICGDIHENFWQNHLAVLFGNWQQIITIIVK